jgi:methylenetetrahydrofolate dehydrogenase (NADP+)/methenyltetrahydrofolate cyclohydrolase
VGRDPTAVYLQQILRTCAASASPGAVEVPGAASTARLRTTISQLNEDPQVAGIIVQMPLPKRIPLSAVTDTLDPAKDIDGIHPLNAGRLTLGHDGFVPTTAQAAVELLKRSGVPIAGRRAVVVGRSNVVGKPAALLLLRENATVTICHSRTTDLASQLKTADIVVVAVGKPAPSPHCSPGASWSMSGSTSWMAGSSAMSIRCPSPGRPALARSPAERAVTNALL